MTTDTLPSLSPDFWANLFELGSDHAFSTLIDMPAQQRKSSETLYIVIGTAPDGSFYELQSPWRLFITRRFTLSNFAEWRASIKNRTYENHIRQTTFEKTQLSVCDAIEYSEHCFVRQDPIHPCKFIPIKFDGTPKKRL